MDLDHRPGESKVSDVAALVKYASMASVRDEIAKCDLVCVLCHRDRTHSRVQEEVPNTRFGRYYLRKRELVWGWKSVPCEQCGQSYKPWQMDLDHRDPSAKHHLRSTRVAGVLSLSLKRLLAERPNLAVLCAACHRLKTFGVS